MSSPDGRPHRKGWEAQAVTSDRPPVVIPMPPPGPDVSGRQGLRDYYLFTEPPKAFSVVYEPAAVASAL